MSTATLLLISGALALAALALIAVSLIRREVERLRGRERVGRAIERDARARAAQQDAADTDGAAGAPGRGLPAHWLQTRLGRMLVADEDRRLIDQCGWPATRAQLVFLAVRAALAVALPLLVLALAELGHWHKHVMLAAAFGFVFGFLLPKWMLAARARRQCAQAARELPLLTDLLRLLQGVGLSLDQSLQIIVNDFSHVLAVLGREVEVATNQYARGRTREHSLQRLATLHGNDNLAGLVGLLVQIDRHGGAVQEPMRLFGDRLREQRRAQMKERIGKITVKMTVVMITTLLPALLIVTGGPGFLAIIRTLGSMSK
jgi:tight adherence protein C